MITGGAGYIGSVATSLLIEAGNEVAIVDDFSNSLPSGLDSRAKKHNFSIHDSKKLANALMGYDAVIHLAASSIVSESVQNPSKYIFNNVEGTRTLLKAMLRANVSRLIFSSTCSVYQSNETQLMNEEMKYGPTSPYAQSKLDSDRLIKEFAMNEKIKSTIFRFFNVSGAYLNSNRHWQGERHVVETHLIPSIISAHKKGVLVPVYGDNWGTLDGSCVRDYVHVVDIARAFLLALETSQSSNYEIYNLGSGVGHSVLSVISEIEKILECKIQYEIKSKREGDSASLIADPSKATKLLKWNAEKSLKDIIQDNITFINI